MRAAGKRALLPVVVLLLVVIGGVGHAGVPSAAAYVNEAITFYRQGNCSKAVELLKKAISLNPSYARAYSWLGLCYVKMGRIREAVEAFKKVIALAPDSEDARVAQQWLNRLQPPAPPPVQSGRTQPPAGPRTPPAQQTPPPGPVYLVDLPAVVGVSQEERPPRVQLFGEVFYKSLARKLCSSGEQNRWRVVYNLQRRYVRLTARVGVADGEPTGWVVAKFVVLGDGAVLFESRPKKSGDVPDSLDVDVRGMLQLELVAWLERSGTCWDVVWADPRVYPPGASLPTPGPGVAGPGSSPATPPVPAGAGHGGPATPATPTSPVPSGRADSLPAAATPTPAVRALAVFPFADSSGGHPDAGAGVASAVLEELFKIGKVDMVSQQRLEQAAAGRVSPLDVNEARQVAQRIGARFIVLGIIERYQVRTSATEITRIYHKDAFVAVAFQVIDVATGERILVDRSGVGLRSAALAPHSLPGDDEMLREASRRVAVDVAQKVALVWAQRTGELTLRIDEAVIARNVERDREFRLVPVGIGSSFQSSAPRIVVYVRGTGGKPGQRMEFIWIAPDGKEYSRGMAVFPAEQQPDQVFVTYHSIRPPAGKPFPPGRWRIQIRVEGIVVKTLTFTVSED
jgi:TolB-like protein